MLFLSYRVTCAFDYDSVYKDHNFELYLDGNIYKKRVIIQLESLLKLRIDGDPIPAYDLIIMDESESLLNQFNSTQTFKNLNKEAFDFLVEIIHNSKKLVCLDGDLENRTYDCIKQFGESINIKNIYLNDIQ